MEEEKYAIEPNLLGASDFFTPVELDIELVQIPEMKGVIYVRAITGEERDRFEESLVVGKGRKAQQSIVNMRAKLICLAACDAEGNSIFAPDAYKKIGKQPAIILERIFSVAARLAGFSTEDIEEMEKNLS